MTEEKQVAKFSIVEADIAKMKSIYMDLRVTNPDDEEGFEAVDSARKVVKKKRVAVDNEEKDLKAEANKWRKKVGSRAKEIRKLIEPIESHLVAQCKIVTDEKARIKAENARLAQEKVDNRMNLLSGYLRPLPYQEVSNMSDEIFEFTLANSKIQWEQDRELERKAEEARKAEADRLEKERLEFEEKQREDWAEQDRIAAEQKKAQDEIDADKKALQDEKDRIESEKILKEAEEELERQIEQEKKDKERLEQEAAERSEALKPDKTRAIEWVEATRDKIDPSQMPVVENKLLQFLVSKAVGQIEKTLSNLHRDIEEL